MSNDDNLRDYNQMKVMDAAQTRDIHKMHRLNENGKLRGFTEHQSFYGTPLMRSIHEYDENVTSFNDRPLVINMVRILLDNNANPFTCRFGRNRWGLLHEASNYGDIDLLRLVLENGFQNLDSVNQSFKPFNFKKGDSSHVNFVNQRDNYNRTPLHVAVLKLARSAHDERHIGIINLLIRHGADVNAMDNGDKTPLFAAVQCDFYDPDRYKNLPLVIALYDEGADLNPSCEETTPLHLCSHCEHITKFLVSHGANLLSRDMNGQLPIHHAALSGNLKSF